MAISDPFQREVAGSEFHRRVGLQLHAPVKTVEVEPCHHRAFGGVIGLFLDNRGERGNLDRGKTERLGLGSAVVVPEAVTVFEQPPDNLMAAGGPIKFVGVGQERCRKLMSAESGLWQQVATCGHEAVGLALKDITHALCKLIEGAEIIERDFYGGLRTGLNASGCSDNTLSGIHPIGTVGAGSLATLQPPESINLVALAVAESISQGIAHGTISGSIGQIKPLRVAVVARKKNYSRRDGKNHHYTNDDHECHRIAHEQTAAVGTGLFLILFLSHNLRFPD